MLLQADVNGPGWTDAQIAAAYHARVRTVEKLRERLVTEGFESVLHGKQRAHPPTPPKLDSAGEAQLIALWLGKPPAGYGQWTLRLPADQLVQLDIVTSICPETARKTLKKNGITKRMVDYWVIPPEQDAEFVAGMEEVLDTYAQPVDPQQPLVCMDEQPYQLLLETRVSLPATATHGTRVDYEYERNGTASIFMFAEPLSGWRSTTAREHRTKADWAQEVAHLLDTRYIGQRITLVVDNLNTHTKGAFYTVFEPAVARAYVKRIDFVYTPKHGSWLNIAECELSALTRQCLTGRRIGQLSILQQEVAAWATCTNDQQRAVDWHFKIDDARVKLKRLYPNF